MSRIDAGSLLLARRRMAAGLLLALLAGPFAAPGLAAEAAAPAKPAPAAPAVAPVTPATTPPAAPAAAAPRTHADAIAAVRELAAKDEAELTYLGVVIAASRIYKPDLDAAAVERQVDEIAAKVKAAAAKAEGGRARVAAMNKVIYGDLGFHTETEISASVTSGEGVLEASLLHRVLERKQGVCLGLATLYLVVAERAGLPVYPVHAPAHVFCRYEDGIDTLQEERFNIECTAQGISPSDEAIARKTGAKRAALGGGAYFKRASKKEVLADQLNNLAYDLGDREKGPDPLTWPQLVEMIELAVKLRPDSQEILDSAAMILGKSGNPVRALALCDQSIELCREHGAPPEVMPFYRKRRAELERAVKEAKTPATK
jgi:regulator of sirC expression with transglutaminase-like and TPR domain